MELNQHTETDSHINLESFPPARHTSERYQRIFACSLTRPGTTASVPDHIFQWLADMLEGDEATSEGQSRIASIPNTSNTGFFSRKERHAISASQINSLWRRKETRSRIEQTQPGPNDSQSKSSKSDTDNPQPEAAWPKILRKLPFNDIRPLGGEGYVDEVGNPEAHDSSVTLMPRVSYVLQGRGMQSDTSWVAPGTPADPTSFGVGWDRVNFLKLDCFIRKYCQHIRRQFTEPSKVLRCKVHCLKLILLRCQYIFRFLDCYENNDAKWNWDYGRYPGPQIEMDRFLFREGILHDPKESFSVDSCILIKMYGMGLKELDYLDHNPNENERFEQFQTAARFHFLLSRAGKARCEDIIEQYKVCYWALRDSRFSPKTRRKPSIRDIHARSREFRIVWHVVQGIWSYYRTSLQGFVPTDHESETQLYELKRTTSYKRGYWDTIPLWEKCQLLKGMNETEAYAHCRGVDRRDKKKTSQPSSERDISC